MYFIRTVVSLTPSWPGWFLADKLFLFLAGDVVPEPVRPDPGAVLVVVGVVWLATSEVAEADRGAVNPGELALVKEVCETNPGPGWSCQRIESVLLLLGLHGDQRASSPLTLSDGAQIVGWAGNNLHTDTA